jgi:hypothetical protein
MTREEWDRLDRQRQRDKWLEIALVAGIFGPAIVANKLRDGCCRLLRSVYRPSMP